ncbi:hypothetical protein ES288_A01G247100v1 [Gossypium darwinii]|uniref:DUF4005 domain-containing protein n=1 Tax=Gossypium darwinii TaxID=34276 RepID=A0A5D2HQA5_GOSDA|nr:hypothetical protein ES288_A01G247100v1 [Gossypium darwinii]
MGKKVKWLSSLKKAFNPESKEKKNQILDKQVHLGPSSSNAAAPTLETVNLSPPPQPEDEKIIKPETVAEATDDDVVVAPAVPTPAAVTVVQRRLNIDSRFAGKSMEEVAAIKIQTAFRVYMAKRALRALRGLVRLKSLMEGPAVKRQVTSTLRSLQRQILQKHAKELVNLQMGEDWDDSLQSKEQIEASLLSKHEAAMRRERAMAYSFTHQQTWKNGSKSMNPLFMDMNNLTWGWSWLERWMAARPWEGRGVTGKEPNNDQSSVKSAHFEGEISKAYARYQLNLDNKQSPKSSQKPNRTSSHLSPSPKPPSTPSPKLKSASPSGSIIAQDDDTRSIVSAQSERNRRHSIAGSLVRDDESLASSPSLPSYMVPTKSARAKTRLQSPLGLEANGTPDKGLIMSTKKRLLYPPSPAKPRRHSGPPRVDTSIITNTKIGAVNGGVI